MNEHALVQSQQPGPDFVIVGPLRAGTTLFRLIMGNHPEIGEIGEFEESVALLSSSGWPSTQHYLQWLDLHRTAVSRKYTLPCDADSYKDIVQAMWTQLTEKQTKPILGCTIHSRIDRILDIWPNTKLICIVRDPRDVCRSCVGMGWYGHPAAASNEWINPIQRWQLARDRLTEDQSVLIRYEDLVREPESVLDRCCTLLGVRFHPDMLTFHESSSYESLDPSLAEQWRRKMDPRTAELIDAACMPTMLNYGYEPSSAEPKPVSAFERCRIRVANRYGRFQFRIRRYGLSLVLQWALAKRLSLNSPWRKSAQERINAIDLKHLR